MMKTKNFTRNLRYKIDATVVKIMKIGSTLIDIYFHTST